MVGTTEFVRQIEEASRGELNFRANGIALWRGTIYVENNISQYEQTIPVLVLDCRQDFSLRLPTGELKLSCNASSDALAFECPQFLSLSPASEVRSLRHLGKEKSLKTLFAEKNVPPWRRKNWPVLSCEEGPVIIPNVAVHDDRWVDRLDERSINQVSPFLRREEPSS